MEKYFLPPKSDFEHLRFCLEQYTPQSIFIRKVGSKGGEVRVDKKIKNKKLSFQLDNTGLLFLLNEKELFKFPMKNWGTRADIGFTLEYERFYPDGRQVFLSHGTNPYDKNLPEPTKSILKNCADDHFLQISFQGRVNLSFYDWLQKPSFALWRIEGKNYLPQEQQ